MNISFNALWIFLLVLFRLSGLIAVAPFFSSQMINNRIKAGMLIILAGFLATTLPMNHPLPAFGPMLFALCGELVAGLVMGFGFHIALCAAEMAGEIAGLQMGLGAASLIDPNSGQSAAVMGNIYSMAFTVLFLLLDGHHHMLRILRDSYATVPAESISIRPPSIEMVMAQGTDALSCGLRLATPVLGPLMLLTVALSLISRAFPQANIYSVSYGVSMLLGFSLLAMSVPSMREAASDSLQQADRFAVQLLRSLGGA